MNPQSAILAEDQRHSLFLTFNCKQETRLPRILSHCANLAKEQQKINTSLHAAIHTAVGLSSRVCKYIWQAADTPAGIQEFTGIPNKAPATGGDFFLHINSDFADLNYELTNRFLEPIHDDCDILDETHGMRYLDERDLTGFIDGTENPEGDADRGEAALIPSGDFQAGSFAFAQKFEHKLEAWKQLSVSEQEQAIGRTKKDSIELDDKKDTAHISRVVIEENGKELEIVRHSLPYFSVSGKKGLFFLAYTNNLGHIAKMLNRMFGVSPDGLSDNLMQFTTPVSGAMFYMPSLETLQHFE